MVLAPGRAAGEFIIFCREKDATREMWDGRRAGIEGAVDLYQADDSPLIRQSLSHCRCRAKMRDLFGVGRANSFRRVTLAQKPNLDYFISLKI